MAGKRRAEPIAKEAARRVKTGDRGSFPSFKDGDVTIRLASPERDALEANDVLVLHREELSRYCDYFRQFDDEGWPSSFVLASRGHGSADDWRVVPQTADATPTAANESSENVESQSKNDRFSAEINMILFKLLYLVPAEFLTSDKSYPASKVLLATARLAVSYGCMDHVRFRFVSALYTAPELGRQAFPRSPAALLETATLLQNEQIFTEAMAYCAGKAMRAGVEILDLTPALSVLVQKEAEALEKRVKRVIRSIRTIEVNGKLSGLVARAIFDRLLAAGLLGEDTGSPAVYDTLRYVYLLQGADQLVEKLNLRWVCDSVETVDRGLVAADQLTEYISDETRDESQRELLHLEDAFGEQLNCKGVKSLLGNILTKARECVTPLFRDGSDVGYFTAIEFGDDDFPWKTS